MPDPINQLDVSVFFGDGSREPSPRSKKWDTAIRTLRRELTKRKATDFVELPLPPQQHGSGRIVTKQTVPYRCLTYYNIGTAYSIPVGWHGRVSVAWREPVHA